jgi:peptide/nickel transport system permease protein
VIGPNARFVGALLLTCIAGAAMTSSAIATHDPAQQFSDFIFAPPMRLHVIDGSGNWRAPFIYPLRLEDRLERRYSEERQRPVRVRWFRDGRLASVDEAQWFPLGTDALGRDVFARLVRGARLSLGVAALAAAGALLIGVFLGGLAGLFGGRIDDVLMRLSDLIIALPGIYTVLTLRAVLPLVLTTTEVFWVMAGVFAAIGWPLPAKGVRAIVAAERNKEYAEAARAAGASRTRLLLRHLLPAARGFLVVQATLLVPAFILAEATLSFIGLGFTEAIPSWGVMLQEAAAGRSLVEAPWLLTPAIAIAATILSINLLLRRASVAGANPVDI